MNERPLSLPAAFREIWRRRLLVIAVAAICGVGGLLHGFLQPQNSTAVALVLLPPSAASTSSVPANGAKTDAVIARSAPVLAAAGARVSPPLGVAKLRSLVTVTALSGQILQIQARAEQGDYAEKLANAVATSYVKYTGQLATSSSGPEVSALQKQSAQLTKQVNDLQSQINTVSARIASEGQGSSAGVQDANLLASLENEQNVISQELNGDTNQIASLQLATGSAENTTRILQDASAAPIDTFGATLQAGLIGFVIGLLGSAVFVLVRLQRDHRLRLRDEIARAAGASVIASIEAPSCTSATAWHELLDSPPRASTEWGLRNIFQTLLHSGAERTGVRVISFAGDLHALTTGPRLVLYAAASGTTAALLPPDTSGPEARSLVALRTAFNGADPVGRGLPITCEPNDKSDGPTPFQVSIVVFNDESSTLAPADTINLLSISPDSVTADQLARLALEVADSGSGLDGVVVVNPESTDITSGLITDEGLRLVPSDVPTNEGDYETVRLEALTKNANGSAKRLSSRER